jgi:hypothetical protein
MWNIEGGLTSAQMMEKAKALILSRGKGFYRVGNNEQLSSTYSSVNVYPLLTLMEYAKDPEVRDAAEAMVLYHLSMVALNNFDGHIMPPFNRRNAVQMRFGPEKKPTGRYMPIHLSIAWLYWGQNEVIPEDFTVGGEMPAALMFAVSDYKVPEPLNRIARGADVPYEIRGSISQFSYYNRGGFADWGGADKPEVLRYVLREKDFAIGGVEAQYFDPMGFNLDYHTFGISWKSPNRFRSLELMHPYWRSNENKQTIAGQTSADPDKVKITGGENYWKATHSPFQQTAVYKNTAIVMFDIPEKDPWAGRGREDWEKQRNNHYDNLIKLAQLRFPVTVDEFTQDKDFYFFREGNVFVGIRVLKSGHTHQELGDHHLESLDGYSDLFHVIQSREAQTGFVFEVGTADDYGSFETFKKRFMNNPLSVDWNSLKVDYTNSTKTNLRFQYDSDYSEDQDGYIWIAPDLWVNGKKRELYLTGWPVAESPVVSMKNGVLKVNQGGNSIMVDWSGELPRIEKN